MEDTDTSDGLTKVTDKVSNMTLNGSTQPLADGDYDVIVLGTGLTECVISGILSVAGLRVLHCDRNAYYGAECASLTLTQLYSHFKSTSMPPNESIIGSHRDYNVDLIPKFIMAGGNMVNLLLHTGVTKYLEFKLVDGSFVFHGGRPHKVPTTPREAMTSGLMGLFEKNRCRQFFGFVQGYRHGDSSTYNSKLDLTRNTMNDVYKYFGLLPDTIAFVGHALALYRDESYRNRPALETVLRIQLYSASLARHGRSPYLYPLYGLGELPQAFARLAAVHGGTYMLHTPVDKVLYKDGKACGIQSQGRVAHCKHVIGDPSYFPEKVCAQGKVVRKYCLLSQPPPNTREATSCQIIIPATQVSPRREHDIYVLVLGSNHKVAPDGRYIALVSTTMETNNPEAELQPGVDLLGDCVIDSFVSVNNLYAPKSSGKDDGIFISKSYDATTHFETTVDDVLDIYRRIFGKDLVLNPENTANGQ